MTRFIVVKVGDIAGIDAFQVFVYQIAEPSKPGWYAPLGGNAPERELMELAEVDNNSVTPSADECFLRVLRLEAIQ